MFSGEKVLGIVPARGGSRRLPRKNITIVAGKPLLLWAVEAGLGSMIVDKTVLSTDDDSVADVATEFGVNDIMMRPKVLGDDDASMTSVIAHTLRSLENQGDHFGYLALLQPTSPLRTSRHIDSAFSLVEEKQVLGAVSVCSTEHPLEWMGKIGSDWVLDSFFNETEMEKQSQEFVPSYQINGAIYIVPVERFLKEETLFLSTGMVAYVMNRRDSVDIDDEYDLRMAEWLLSERQREQGTSEHPIR